MFRTVTLALLAAVILPVKAATTITMLHFSDYHSHAVPFYSEGSEKGGVARAIGLMERYKRNGALVFSGGDTMNSGAPAWSDKYRCAEWPWLNGIVDAMAFGNHDADYGNEDFARCQALAKYPILSANTTGFERYRIFERKGIRIGVFALAGSDFPRLVTHAKMTFTDPVAAARDVVQILRDREHVDAVVMIGHEHADDDYKLVAQVPGIDVVFGSHTHLKRELTRIPGTRTWFISPFQYLTYVSVIHLTFDGKTLTGVTGGLVKVDASVKPDRTIARRVSKMQRELEADPAYRDLFRPIAKLSKPMEIEELAQFTIEMMRTAAGSDLAMSTLSSFRGPLPSGTIDLETLRAAMPYDNEIVTVRVSGAKLGELYARVSGDPAGEAYAFTTPAPSPIDPDREYTVAMTDYMAKVSTAYRGLFSPADVLSTGIRVRSEAAKRLTAQAP